MSILLHVLMLIMIFSAPALRAAQDPLRMEAGAVFHKADLLPHTAYLVDSDGSIMVEDLPGRDSEMMAVTGRGVFIFNKDVFWIQFQIDNRLNETRPLTLMHAQSYLDRVDLFEWKDGHAEKLMLRGDRVPDPAREFRHALFPLQVTPGLHTYYARIQTDGPMNLQFYAWEPDALARYMRNDFLAIGLLFGFIAVMVAYNSFIGFRLRIPYYFVYVGYIVCFGLVQFHFTGMSRYVFPDHPFASFLIHEGIIFAAEIAGICGCLFAIPFLDLRSASPRLVKAIYAAFSLSILNMIISVFDFNLSSSLVLFTNAILSNLLVYAGVSSCFRRYRPAYFYTAAWLFIIVGSLITMSRIYGFLPDNTFTAWSQFVGGAIEVVLLSLALGDKISFEQEQSHAAITQLNTELNKANDNLKEHIENVEAIVDEKTRDIRSIMEHIPLGVFMIKTDGTLHKDHSRSIQAIFAGQIFEASPACSLIFARSSLNTDEISQAESCIQAAMGEDVLNFQMNAHALPLEIRRTDDRGHAHIFELTWNPIETAAGTLDKILVTMRDVTEIRSLQEQSRDQQQELEFIGEILSVPTPRFIRFMNSCRELIQENVKLVGSQGIQKRNIEILKLLFINMHTIKGSARSLYLKKLAHIFHDIEQYYALLQKDPNTPWDVEKMKAGLADAQRIVHVYENLAKEKLGRGVDLTHVIEFRTEQIETLYRSLSNALRGETLPLPIQESVGDIQALFFHKIFKDVREVFQDLSGCLPLLAKDLQKEIPNVDVETGGILFGDRAEELFRNIFVHILRNSMDHGLESARERVDAGKAAKGRLMITMERQDETLVLRYGDDGRGLNLTRIAEVGLARGIVTPDEARDPHNVAALIFDSGLSTANQLTEISGRGVGMGAVRRFIEDCGGHITLDLQLASGQHDGYCPFQFVITLPFDLFEEPLYQNARRAA
ncbi:MAG TPA: 7TM diverse intracellular signaling domain-containing protein [Oligoflexus sp.]|uniref:7TM diverse intracellular signaling domain-containing protein n=1 Tax=Oligoflexus sp. TaxID=1971216 RepID=UPI002D80794A|nr:7TM diverse intracellular signaling domain-containing protein [Oligoflexus sp.]HET9237941.1 7TM diverse intracellular signaling domain-containing protein [Oligoflexus sp.]